MAPSSNTVILPSDFSKKELFDIVESNFKKDQAVVIIFTTTQIKLKQGDIFFPTTSDRIQNSFDYKFDKLIGLELNFHINRLLSDECVHWLKAGVKYINGGKFMAGEGNEMPEDVYTKLCRLIPEKGFLFIAADQGFLHFWTGEDGYGTRSVTLKDPMIKNGKIFNYTKSFILNTSSAEELTSVFNRSPLYTIHEHKVPDFLNESWFCNKADFLHFCKLTNKIVLEESVFKNHLDNLEEVWRESDVRRLIKFLNTPLTEEETNALLNIIKKTR